PRKPRPRSSSRFSEPRPTSPRSPRLSRHRTPEEKTMDATFWAFVALVIFIAIIVYMKVPAMIGRSLDERADNIRKELEEARTLREEAQQLLAEYHRKRKEAEKEAGDIVASAEREAK